MEYLVVLYLLTTVIFSAVTGVPVDDLDDKWEKFKVDNRRTYDTAEDIRRKEIFSHTLENIEAHNKQAKEGLVSYNLTVNKFADWTDEEKQKMLRTDYFSDS